MSKKRIASTFGIDPDQKEAMALVKKETGIPPTVQIEFSLSAYLIEEHGALLKKHGFKVDESGKLIAPK
jgi:uncharacterized protein YxjI